jgi:hypothetical protein
MNDEQPIAMAATKAVVDCLTLRQEKRLSDEGAREYAFKISSELIRKLETYPPSDFSGNARRAFYHMLFAMLALPPVAPRAGRSRRGAG